MEYVSINRGYCPTEKYRKKYIRSHLEGVTPGLRDQFEAMRSTSAEEVRETALVHCHNALIERYLETIGTCSAKVQPRKTKTDYSAYHSGMDDGRSISLHRQINGGNV